MEVGWEREGGGLFREERHVEGEGRGKQGSVGRKREVGSWIPPVRTAMIPSRLRFSVLS